ncbi:MAG: FMN-binding protein [Spirochaetota bacterium]|nr:FMN-binding protein [Spirochaetota bacterium]
MNPNIKNILKSTVVLAIVAFSASFVLSHVYRITHPNILKQAKEKQERALSVVLPGYSNITEKKIKIDEKDFQYWIGKKWEDGKTRKGYAFIAEKAGYSGLVKTMVGVNELGIILGISILQQTETPGLGARCIELPAMETFWGYLFGESSTDDVESILPWFQEQFNGLNANNRIEILKKGDWNPDLRNELLKKNAISAITGATITTRAVRDGIETGFQLLGMAEK